ncbi:hypothetical protein DFH08DRAFT_1033877 [Mycena albidolilacea]|uniref:SCP domain-containing protein n=1 Tax=Mycena albidolilacea TaxID=1033008 RepID=A0AAD7EH53_9AGAR|nr:hypothetical protein DFH08DRAFT_1033877 [Mycena albidolilacea]
MRLFTPLFCVFVAAPSVLALEPQEIIDTLNNLRNQANAITPKLEKLYDPKVQSTLQDVWDSKAPLDALTVDYIQFGDNVKTTQGRILDQSTAKALADAATQHSEALSTMGVALARGLFTYNEYSHYLYEKGCNDGVEIGVKAIALFSVLGVKFPNVITTVVLEGLLEVVCVPLQQLSAAECFVPILPPIGI